MVAEGEHVGTAGKQPEGELGVISAPLATFSSLAITKSPAHSYLKAGHPPANASRPRCPNASPMKRMFNRSLLRCSGPCGPARPPGLLRILACR